VLLAAPIAERLARSASLRRKQRMGSVCGLLEKSIAMSKS
jgi:hypothetical protein